MKRALRFKIVDQRRFTLFCTATALIFAGIICAVFTGVHSVNASENTYTLIYVGEGDTLWSIAKENCPENTDIRTAVSDIKAVNGMCSSTIYPGEALYVPVY